MGEEKLGIKEISEVFDALDVLAQFGGQVMANGKVDAGDITALVGLATQFEKLSEGAKGADGALKEAKDLDQAEVLAVVGRVYQVVKKFSDAKKA